VCCIYDGVTGHGVTKDIQGHSYYIENMAALYHKYYNTYNYYIRVPAAAILIQSPRLVWWLWLEAVGSEPLTSDLSHSIEWDLSMSVTTQCMKTAIWHIAIMKYKPKLCNYVLQLCHWPIDEAKPVLLLCIDMWLFLVIFDIWHSHQQGQQWVHQSGNSTQCIAHRGLSNWSPLHYEATSCLSARVLTTR